MPAALSLQLRTLLRELDGPIRAVRANELAPRLEGRPPAEGAAVLENEIIRLGHTRFAGCGPFVAGLVEPLQRLNDDARLDTLLDLAALLVALDVNDLHDVLETLAREAG